MTTIVTHYCDLAAFLEILALSVTAATVERTF